MLSKLSLALQEPVWLAPQLAVSSRVGGVAGSLGGLLTLACRHADHDGSSLGPTSHRTRRADALRAGRARPRPSHSDRGRRRRRDNSDQTAIRPVQFAPSACLSSISQKFY